MTKRIGPCAPRTVSTLPKKYTRTFPVRRNLAREKPESSHRSVGTHCWHPLDTSASPDRGTRILPRSLGLVFRIERVRSATKFLATRHHNRLVIATATGLCLSVVCIWRGLEANGSRDDRVSSALATHWGNLRRCTRSGFMAPNNRSKLQASQILRKRDCFGRPYASGSQHHLFVRCRSGLS
jgi:hypothetical protein